MLILFVFTCQVMAVQVDTHVAAALVDQQQTSEAQRQLSALTAVVSKKSGLTVSQLLSEQLVDEDFRPAILRSYFEDIPRHLDANELWYNVVVDEDRLNRLMIDKEIPVWPAQRGDAFVWVVEELEDGNLINAPADSAASYWLRQWFRHKGLPARFYDYQAEDLLAFQPRDVRFLNPDLIDFIQQNHQPDLTLLVFVKHSRNGLSYRVGLQRGDEPIQIKNLKFVNMSSGMSSLADLAQSMMASGQQVFAEEFSENTVSLLINNLANAEQLIDLKKYFDQHALIDRYQIQSFSNGRLSIMANIKVLPETFIKFVDAGQMLQHMPLDIGQSILFSVAE
ncbi:DUF2066 domain-containing protein [Marinicella sediminis]|nr:DUF2066 domain-containing protein [Marinicella sediminis]